MRTASSWAVSHQQYEGDHLVRRGGKRTAVFKKIRQGAKNAGVGFEMYELARHTGVRCGDVTSTVPRHNEIPEEMAEVIFKQLVPVLGKRWWTK